MTVEEELTQLDEQVRRLKIEFEVYFNGGRDRPPTDMQWRVEATVKKYNENTKLSYAQRFRFNTIAQRYQIHNDMWRQKLKAKEEGREPRRRQTAAAQEASGAFRVQWHDPDQEQEKVEKLFAALVEAKRTVGESTDALPLDNFKRFVKMKTEQLKKDFGCSTVEYVVEVENGQVRLKAKGGGT